MKALKKQGIKRILSFLIMLCMILGQLPQLATAADPLPTKITIDGVELNSTYRYLVKGKPAKSSTMDGVDCTAYFSYGVGILYLKNYQGGPISLNEKTLGDGLIRSKLIIDISGDNKITNHGAGIRYGIYNGLEGITIRSDDYGKLSIETSSENNEAFGVRSNGYNSVFTMLGNPTLSVNINQSSNNKNEVVGISFGSGGAFIQDQSSLYMNLSGFTTTGIKIIKGGNVDVSNNNYITINSYGVYKSFSFISNNLIIRDTGNMSLTAKTFNRDVVWNSNVRKYGPVANGEYETVYYDKGIIRNIKIESGTISQYDYLEGDIVTITANPPNPYFKFKEWQGANGLTFLDSTSKTSPVAKFKMPAIHLDLVATYEGSLITGLTKGGTVASGKDFTFSWTISDYTDRAYYAKIETLDGGVWKTYKDLDSSYEKPGTYSSSISSTVPGSKTFRLVYKIGEKESYSEEFTINWVNENEEKDSRLKDIRIYMDSSGGKINFAPSSITGFDPEISEYTIAKGKNTRGLIYMDKEVEGQTAWATINGNSAVIVNKGNRFEFGPFELVDAGDVFIVTVRSKDESTSKTYKMTFTDEKKVLTGKVTISGKEQFGETLTANVSDTNNTGTLSYKWTRSSDVGDFATGNTYFIDKRFDAGSIITCEVTSSVQTGSIKATTGVLPKLDGADAPTGLLGVNPTVVGKADGKITGTTKLMEYADNIEFKDAKDCSATETIGLKAGGYYVRIKATETHNPSKHVSITIGTDIPLKFTKSLAYDIPESTIGKAINNIDLSEGVVGGKKPYKFSALGLPMGTTISNEGVISGTPTSEIPAGTATITVMDSSEKPVTEKITISYGKVSKQTPLDKDKETDKDKDKEIDKDFSSKDIDNALKTGEGSLTINEGKAEMVFDKAALTEIKNQSGSKDVKFNIGIADKSKLDLNQKATVGDNIVYDLSVTSDGKTITDFKGNVRVSLPYTPKPGENLGAIVIYYVDHKGAIQVIRNGRYDAKLGVVSFITDHFSFYMIKNNYIKFTDIKDTHWAKPAIDFSAARKLVEGMGNNEYKPSGELTRAQLVKMIQNVLNLPAAKPNLETYTDVKSGQWFYDSIMPLKSAGLLEGVKLDKNNFNPNQPITREEMAVILANTATYKKVSIPTEKIDLTKFTDYKEINKGFQDRIIIAMKLGFLNKDGKGGGIFAPKATTTRAEAAQVQINLFNALSITD